MKLLCLALVGFGITACYQNVPAQMPPIPVEELEQITYTEVNELVFKPRCIGCHGAAGGVNLQTFENVIQNLAAIQLAVETDRMPKGSPLTDDQKDLLFAWIEAGAPKEPAE